MLLIENTVTGLIVLFAIMIASVPLGLVALASSGIGTGIALVSGAEKAVINQGLFGYNSVLTGLALSLFLSGEKRWGIALAGAAVTVLFTAALMHLLKAMEVPILTFPYILLTWSVLLASFGLASIQLSPNLVPQDLSHWKLQAEGHFEATELIEGVGQIYFLENIYSSFLILIGIFWASWRMGLYAVVGTVLSSLTAYGLGAGSPSFNSGLYGYNAVLAIMAVTVVFKDRRHNSIPAGIVAAILTVPLMASITDVMIPYGLPALTMPFVIVTWLFLSLRKVLPKL